MTDQLAELREFLSHSLEARKDRTKSTVRRLMTTAVVLLSLGIIWSATLVVGAILLANGLAEAVGIMVGNRLWAGEVIIGAGIVLSTLLLTILWAEWFNRSARQRTIRKYDRRHRMQRAKFGADVRQRAAS
jgi:hypothetical protein